MKRPYTANIFENIAELDFEVDGFEIESAETWQGEVNRKSRDHIPWVQSALNRENFDDEELFSLDISGGLRDESPFPEPESADWEYESALDVLSPSELKAVRITSTFETGRAGGFGGLTGNFDGQGLSFGLLNFTIKAGSLIPLLQEFINKYPARYSSAFGKDAARFKEMVFTTKPDPKNPKRRIRDVERQMAFVNQMNAIPKKAKGNRIIEPWKTYFGRLENDPEFQKIQVKAVRGALDRARYWYNYFDFKTERGFAFMFDLVSSAGGAWLNAAKFKGKRRELLRKMLADKKTRLGRGTLTELEKMEVIANMIADVSLEEWREKARVRKLWFVRGSGKVHGRFFDIKKDFGVTDDPPVFGAGASPRPSASELAGDWGYPSGFAWPGEMEFETARPQKRKNPGTDCGSSGAPAALVSQPGGRCIGPTPPVCPSVTGILSLQSIGNIPFEYIVRVGKNRSTNLMVVTQRLRPRTQRFLPSVRTALTRFVDNMNRFGMPIEAILTAGSYCCRCISKTNSLSNHSHGDAFDLVGVRWTGGGETIAHNWNTAERALLRRINACLRLSFPTVIDYHRADHRDHFHCDMNRGNSRNTRNIRRPDTLRFTQEALSLVLGRTVPVTGKLDAATQRALIEFGGTNADALGNSAQLNEILDRLFTIVAAPPAGVPRAEEELNYERSAPTGRPVVKGGLRTSRGNEPPGLTLYEQIPLGQESPAKPKTGIFVPVGFRPQSQVDLIIYLHGMKAPSGLSTSATIDVYWSRRYPFLLREGVNQSGKNVVLVAPTLGPASQAGRLTDPGGFDWYVDQVMRVLAERGPYQQASQPPQVGNIVLACHSAGGKIMRLLALGQHRYSNRIRECWGFDCLYNSRDPEVWRQWAISHPNVGLFIYYLGSTEGHSKNLQGIGKPPVPPPDNVKVEKSNARYHNLVPMAHWVDRIRRAPFLK